MVTCVRPEPGICAHQWSPHVCYRSDGTIHCHITGWIPSRFPAIVSLSAAWLLTILTWPLYGLPKIAAFWSFVPFNAEAVILFALAVTAVLGLGVTQRLYLMLIFFLMFVLSAGFYMLGWPASVVLIVPGIASFAFSALLFASTNKQRLTMIGFWVIIGSVALVVGPVHYSAGLVSYTAAAEFPTLSTRVHTIYNGEVSLLLWTPIHPWSVASFFSPERTFVGGGILGCLLMAFSGSATQRQIGFSIVILEAGLICLGVTNYLFNYWIGPAISYFELTLFPFLALGLSYLLLIPISQLFRLAHGSFFQWQQRRAVITAVCSVGISASHQHPRIERGSRSASRE